MLANCQTAQTSRTPAALEADFSQIPQVPLDISAVCICSPTLCSLNYSSRHLLPHRMSRGRHRRSFAPFRTPLQDLPMKGPSLQYDIRALRTFVCDACGRQCPLPGRFTSCQCSCSTPPRWMRLLDRQRVPVPDVSQFLSPADPADTFVDENASDEVIPGWKPPVFERAPQGPQRRRLSEDLPRLDLSRADDTTVAEDTPGDDGFNPAARPLDTAPRHDSPRFDAGRRREPGERSASRDSRPPRRDRGMESGGQRPRRVSGRGSVEPRSNPRQPQRSVPPSSAPPTPGEDFGSGVDPDPFTAPAADQASQPPERRGSDNRGRNDRGPRRGRRRGGRGRGAQGSPGTPDA